MSQMGEKKAASGFNPAARYQQTPTKSNPFSLHANKGRSGKFISHLLGLDHEAPAEAGGIHVNGVDNNGQAVKHRIQLKDMLHGIKFTPNFMFFLLFFGFFLWLFVIYWVRHNEPLADSVLGTPKGNQRKAAADRRLVAGIKNAFPVQTSATTGEIYVPNTPVPTQIAEPRMQQQVPMQPVQPQQLNYQNQYQANASPLIVPAPQQSSSSYGNPYGTSIGDGQNMQIPGVNAMTAVPVGQGNYMVGVPSNSGTRVKTIVNR